MIYLGTALTVECSRLAPVDDGGAGTGIPGIPGSPGPDGQSGESSLADFVTQLINNGNVGIDDGN